VLARGRGLDLRENADQSGCPDIVRMGVGLRKSMGQAGKAGSRVLQLEQRGEVAPLNVRRSCGSGWEPLTECGIQQPHQTLPGSSGPAPAPPSSDLGLRHIWDVCQDLHFPFRSSASL
jgi:hypothetical protein